MRQIVLSISALIAWMILLSGCSAAQKPVSEDRILIVYLSRTKNTKAVAHMIHRKLGGKLVEIEPQKPYPENYQETVEQVAKENETSYLPPLKTKIDSIEKYEAVFVGFPTWGMKLPPPMKSFLSQYNLKGKKVIPFNTNGGYGTGSSFETVNELCPESELLRGLSIRGGSERDGELFVMHGEKEKDVDGEVTKWLKTIGLLE
ncbi:flavodoxin [Terrimonas sp. NA20]|uniref:Flavodoxin n=1 Tax=Terrimonas ginsenosidimutans TaxID=2908004 RepID=A0ABS9KMH3_9BACT|nr:flavodoxin [Terrimonas ginsenosidimutans]MCG2613527.1 flavodoxin [Terrimonas ginsenosidimutans]